MIVRTLAIKFVLLQLVTSSSPASWQRQLFRPPRTLTGRQRLAVILASLLA